MFSLPPLPLAFAPVTLPAATKRPSRIGETANTCSGPANEAIQEIVDIDLSGTPFSGAFQATILDGSYFLPSPDEWRSGERWMVCQVTAVAPDGTVRVQDALWRARTNRATPLAAGEPVVVAGLDGLVVTGGEPTLQEALPAFLGKVRALGLLVKLDTNGSRPEMLARLLGLRLCLSLSLCLSLRLLCL